MSLRHESDQKEPNTNKNSNQSSGWSCILFIIHSETLLKACEELLFSHRSWLEAADDGQDTAD